MITISASDFNKLEADAKAYQPIKNLSFLDTLTLQWNVNKAKAEEQRLSRWVNVLAKKEEELEKRTRELILREDEVANREEAIKSLKKAYAKNIKQIPSFIKWLFNLNGKEYESI